MATFLIVRASADDNLANFFYWYLVVESEELSIKKSESVSSTSSSSSNTLIKDNKITKMYFTVLRRFLDNLERGDCEMKRRKLLLTREQQFMDKLVQLIKCVAREKGDRIKKIEKLQSFLCDSEMFKFNFKNFEPIPLPLDPRIKIQGIIPEKATLFKSALMPSRLTFLTTDNSHYITILKHGDDLRQDQLILQTITLMDKLLRRENLDLKLTPYCVLAISSKHGFVQYIDSIPVAEVIKTQDIQKFFRDHAPAENVPYGISPDVMDTYVKSCGKYIFNLLHLF